jgi:hypothetical protein
MQEADTEAMTSHPPADPVVPTPTTAAEEHFALHDLTVDGDPVEIETATVTRKSSWVVALTDWIKGINSWRGRIVSKSYRAGADEKGQEHKLTAEGPEDQIITGDFTQQPNPRGVDMTGAGELIVTDKPEPAKD